MTFGGLSLEKRSIGDFSGALFDHFFPMRIKRIEVVTESIWSESRSSGSCEW